jgi:hypothetical protein
MDESEITNVGQLDELCASKTLRYVFHCQVIQRKPPVKVKLTIPGLEQSEQENWQDHVNKYLAVCGCRIGAIWAYVGIAFYGIYTVVSLWKTPEPSYAWRRVLFGIAVFLMSGILGKTWSIQGARRDFSRVVEMRERLLFNRISTPKPPDAFPLDRSGKLFWYLRAAPYWPNQLHRDPFVFTRKLIAPAKVGLTRGGGRPNAFGFSIGIQPQSGYLPIAGKVRRRRNFGISLRNFSLRRVLCSPHHRGIPPRTITPD